MAFSLMSPAFAHGATIPAEYTCDGADRSPPLAWSGAPAATKTFALICDDPDAPGKTFVHWVLYDLPAEVHALAAGLAPDAALAEPEGARQGPTDFGQVGYGGPCPPPGKPHRYSFTLYALGAPLGLSGATKADVERAIAGHVLAQAQLMGTYGRTRPQAPAR
jgi:hypothetical protein